MYQKMCACQFEFEMGLAMAYSSLGPAVFMIRQF